MSPFGIDNANAIEIPPRSPAQVNIIVSFLLARFDFFRKRLDDFTAINRDNSTIKIEIIPRNISNII
jgi:hypothetical protein